MTARHQRCFLAATGCGFAGGGAASPARSAAAARKGTHAHPGDSCTATSPYDSRSSYAALPLPHSSAAAAQHSAPPRSRRRLWRPMETPEASSDDEEDEEDDEDENERRRRRFVRMRRPVRPVRRPAAPASADADTTMGEPIVISSDDEF